MARRLTIPLALLASTWVVATPAAAAEGYFKDLFIDGGCWLTARESLAAADFLGLSSEALALPYEPTDEDIQIQVDKIAGTADDTNGCLLYPDGAPRFRLIQTNGGSATRHGRTLGEDGRQRVRDFYAAGGSYTGTCAGFFLATVAAFDDGVNENYYRIWPGRADNTGLLDTYTGMFIEPSSPLLDYFDFGGDEYVADLYHNGGGYADEDHPEWPDGTEILARFDYPGRSMHEQVSCLAYKADAQSGRLVIIGSHPEGVSSGERRDLMAGMMLYALDGQGEVQVKGELENGVWRTMDRLWEDGDPSHARIGDRQIHHFAVEVPPGATDLVVTLEGDESYDLDLYLRDGDFAFPSAADASSASRGSHEEVSLAAPETGRWYVGVQCATSVTETARSGYVEYTGDLGVLNGVEYAVMAEYSVVHALSIDLPEGAAEDQGSVSGAVRASPAPLADLDIHLESSDPARVAVPSNVVLTAGEDYVGFRLDLVDNAAHDGDCDVTVSACGADYDCTAGTLRVTDDDVAAPSCDGLGGVCCAAALQCDYVLADETTDCDGVCCLSGSCRDSTGDATGADEPLGEDMGAWDGGPAAEAGAGADGCACRSASQPNGPALPTLWIAALTLVVGRRRARRQDRR